MSQYAKKRDANSKAVIDYLRKHGVDVLDLSNSGRGVTDIATYWRDVVFIEIKHGKEAKLRKGQIRFLADWKGYCGIARNEEEALNLATNPGEYALTDSQKMALKQFLVRMTEDKAHLATVMKEIER